MRYCYLNPTRIVSYCYLKRRIITEMALSKVLDEEVPYHARIYPMYYPIRGYGRGVIVYYDEELQKETDDMIDDHDGKAPVAVIERAFKDADKDFIGFEMLQGNIFHHSTHNLMINLTEQQIRKKNWSIKDFTIFHIWNISLDNKASFLSWSAKFESSPYRIELEIHIHDKNENGTSHTKVVGFLLDTNQCDSVKLATVDDCEVKYSLFSHAYRVKFEIRSYNDDGSPALNVKGRVRAYFELDGNGKKYEKYLFGGEEEYEKSEHVVGRDTLIICPALILPRNLSKFRLDISLNDEAGNFAFNKDKLMIHRRSIAVDEELHNLGEKGYIILRAIWACLCVDLKHGICTCPGTAIGFQAENVDSGEVTKYESVSEVCRPVITCDEDSTKGRMKRTKVEG